MCISSRRTIIIPAGQHEFDRSILVTTDGFYVFPPEAKNTHITLWGGGGGGGGGSHKIPTSDLVSGGGGGAGGYIVYRYPIKNRAASFTAVIGQGGIGGEGELLDDGESGGDGTSTVAIFNPNTQLLALGGEGGHRSCISSAGNVLEKGFGGVNQPLILSSSLQRYSITGANGGDGDGFEIPGSPGSPMFFYQGGNTSIPNGGGGGGAGPRANGGDGGIVPLSLNGTTPPPNSGAGGGGGAAMTDDLSPNRGGTGGDGASGGILIEYDL